MGPSRCIGRRCIRRAISCVLVQLFVFTSLVLLGDFCSQGFTLGGSVKSHPARHVAVERGASTLPSSPANAGRLTVASPFGMSAKGKNNILQDLRGISTVIPDEFSLEQYEKFGARLAFVSSRTVLTALSDGSWPGMAELVEQAKQNEQCVVDWGLVEEATTCFEESLFALMESVLLSHSAASFGMVSTEIPSVALATPEAAVASGRRILELYEDLGVASERVLFRVPASYEGLRAAAALIRVGWQRTSPTSTRFNNLL